MCHKNHGFLALRKSKAGALRCAANTLSLRVTAFLFLFLFFVVLTRMGSIAHKLPISDSTRTKYFGSIVILSRRTQHNIPVFLQNSMAIFRRYVSDLTSFNQLYKLVWEFRCCNPNRRYSKSIPIEFHTLQDTLHQKFNLKFFVTYSTFFTIFYYIIIN